MVGHGRNTVANQKIIFFYILKEKKIRATLMRLRIWNPSPPQTDENNIWFWTKMNSMCDAIACGETNQRGTNAKREKLELVWEFFFFLRVDLLWNHGKADRTYTQSLFLYRLWNKYTDPCCMYTQPPISDEEPIDKYHMPNSIDVAP